MGESKGNSNTITRQYLDSLLVETRYMNSACADLTMELYGKKFPSPVMTAALSHLDHFMHEGATQAYAEGAAKAGAVLWLGMADKEEVERCAATGAAMIEIIKPYTDRALIYEKIRHAEELGLLAVGVDIDHAFGPDGSPDVGEPVCRIQHQHLLSAADKVDVAPHLLDHIEIFGELLHSRERQFGHFLFLH